MDMVQMVKSILRVPEDSARIQREAMYACKFCGKQCDLSPGPGMAVCPEHCEDHSYVHVKDLRGHYCEHCGKPAPDDWFDD